jgi:hypothetical protein
MADAPYLIALALLQQNGQRAMPLQGKSLREPIAAEADPGDEGHRQALELLLRVWQRTDNGPLHRAAGDQSLLVAEVPMGALMEQLPALKARWIRDGDTSALVAGLMALGGGLWSLHLEQRGPLVFHRLVSS